MTPTHYITDCTGHRSAIAILDVDALGVWATVEYMDGRRARVLRERCVAISISPRAEMPT